MNVLLTGTTDYIGAVVAEKLIAAGRRLVRMARTGRTDTRTLSDLRTIDRSLHARVVPDEISVAGAGRAFDSDGILNDPHPVEKVRNVGGQVARFALLRSSDHPREFLRFWKESRVGPGGARPPYPRLRPASGCGIARCLPRRPPPPR